MGWINHGAIRSASDVRPVHGRGRVVVLFLTRLSAVLSGTNIWLWIPCAAFIGALFVGIDIFSPRKKLAVLSGAFLGPPVGVAIAFAPDALSCNCWWRRITCLNHRRARCTVPIYRPAGGGDHLLLVDQLQPGRPRMMFVHPPLCRIQQTDKRGSADPARQQRANRRANRRYRRHGDPRKPIDRADVCAGRNCRRWRTAAIGSNATGAGRGLDVVARCASSRRWKFTSSNPPRDPTTAMASTPTSGSCNWPRTLMPA